MKDDRLHSGFLNHDYLVVFAIADERRRRRLIEQCEGPWMGDAISDSAWEVSNDLSPDAMEKALGEHLCDGDRCAYYYLTPPMPTGVAGAPPSKRIFRVVLG